MCALSERFGELRDLAEYNATVPFRVRGIPAVLFVGGLGRHERAVKLPLLRASALLPRKPISVTLF